MVTRTPRRLAVVLADAGIDEDRFTRVAARAIDELRAPEAEIDDPTSQLTTAEAASLKAGGLDLARRRRTEPDPVGEAAARYAAILADSEDVAQVAERLGVTRARVRQRAAERTLLAIREGDEWRFPRAQFADGAPIRGLPAVSVAMPPDLHPVAVWAFLKEPSSDLPVGDRPVSPLDWLRSGGSPEPVAAIAREL
jgi:excisionase family DNA binding protein